jgi:hypothetical protein
VKEILCIRFTAFPKPFGMSNVFPRGRYRLVVLRIRDVFPGSGFRFVLDPGSNNKKRSFWQANGQL